MSVEAGSGDDQVGEEGQEVTIVLVYPFLFIVLLLIVNLTSLSFLQRNMTGCKPLTNKQRGLFRCAKAVGRCLCLLAGYMVLLWGV